MISHPKITSTPPLSRQTSQKMLSRRLFPNDFKKEGKKQHKSKTVSCIWLRFRKQYKEGMSVLSHRLNLIRMPHLPRSHGATYLNELWSYVLLEMFGIKHSSQLELLPLPPKAESRWYYSLRFRWKVDKWVLENVSRIVVPRSNEIIKYLCRTSDCFEWIKRREISDLRPGMTVDFQDAFKSWRRAVISKIFLDKN